MVRKTLRRFQEIVPAVLRNTLYLRMFGLFRIPMIFYVRPTVASWSLDHVEVVVPLTRRTRNHWNSMYFGALAVGADCAAAMVAFYIIDEKKIPASVIFKDFKADFLRRPESDVHFISKDGRKVADLIDRAAKSKERENATVIVTATTPEKSGDEIVAEFTLTLSVKVSAKK